VLAQDLHADGALTGDHVGVVERVHEGQVAFGFELQRATMRIGEAVAVQHDLGAERAHSVDLEPGRGGRHDDECRAAELASREGDALGMVACRRADHPTPQRFRAQA